jgi:membrane protease subunit HflC
MKKLLLSSALAILALLAVRYALFTVDATEYAYVTLLGQHVATYDGSDNDGGAGLHVGWPWPLQLVQRLDRRLQQFDLPPMEQLTHDPEGNTIDKILMIEAYACWKIADRDAVDRFVRRIGTADRARQILAPRINGQLGAAIGQMKMDDLVNTSIVDQANGLTKVDATVEALRLSLLKTLQGPVRDEYGIDLVDIRLRRFNHPGNVRDSIFQRIRSERSKKVTEYQSEGDRLARNLESEADEKVRGMLARARSEEEKIKGQADTEAMRIRNQAYVQDPEFYTFLKKLEKLQGILGDNKTMLLLSTNRPMFESLFQPPHPKVEAPPAEKK